MGRSLPWSSILAAALLGGVIGSLCNAAAAQGLRPDGGSRSPWSFGVGGFSQGSAVARRAQAPMLGLDLQRPGLALDPGSGWRDDLRFGMSRAPRPLALDRLGEASTASTFSARGVSGTARYALPLGGLQLFGGGGAGLYQFRAGLDDRYDPLAGNLGLHAVAGVSLPVADDTEVGISLRRVWIRGEAAGTAGTTVDEGGRFIFFGLRLTR